MVEDYNREDCESAERLRDWLEQLRGEIVAGGGDLPRPELREGDASEAISELDAALERLRDGLLDGVPVDPEERSEGEHARFVLAHMMEFHRREDKASWWEYFRLLELEENDLFDERRAIAGLEHVGTLDPKAAPLERYRFPPQELDARPGDGVFGLDGVRLGSVDEVNFAARTIDIKKRKDTATLHPRSGVFHAYVSSKALQASLMRLGEAVLENGLDLEAPYAVARRLLLREPPPTNAPNGALQHAGEPTLDAACRIALALDGDVLPIQGPPGTGKTYTGAKIICELVRAGLRVGVAAVSHKVIVNLLEAAAEQAVGAGLEVSLVHCRKGRYEGPWAIQRMDG